MDRNSTGLLHNVPRGRVRARRGASPCNIARIGDRLLPTSPDGCLSRGGIDHGLSVTAGEPAIVVVEWPKDLAKAHWPGAKVIRFEHVDETTRRITT